MTTFRAANCQEINQESRSREEKAPQLTGICRQDGVNDPVVCSQLLKDLGSCCEEINACKSSDLLYVPETSCHDFCTVPMLPQIILHGRYSLRTQVTLITVQFAVICYPSHVRGNGIGSSLGSSNRLYQSKHYRDETTDSMSCLQNLRSLDSLPRGADLDSDFLSWHSFVFVELENAQCSCDCAGCVE